VLKQVLFNYLEDLRVEAGKILPKLKSYSKFDFYRKDQVSCCLFKTLFSEHVLVFA
jgi:hypothetical protein